MADLKSGEWLFGRGTADMKGGLAVAIAYLEEQCALPDPIGSLLVIAVPDEEAFSEGARDAARLLTTLRERYGLRYEFLIDPEPTARAHGVQTVPIGSAGKCLPVVVVQGATAHVDHGFEGLNPLGILSSLILRTELEPELCDIDHGEACVPPVWLSAADQTSGYSASVPSRASGYLNFLTFTSSPAEVLRKLKMEARAAVDAYLAQMDLNYDEYVSLAGEDGQEPSGLFVEVLTFGELSAGLRESHGSRYDAFFSTAYNRCAAALQRHEMAYPQATIQLMNEVLTWSGRRTPTVLLGFAPPFYPAMHSDDVPGKEGIGSRYAALVAQALSGFGLNVRVQHHFTGISDLSYCAVTVDLDEQALASEMPLWGDAYAVDVPAIASLGIPGMLLGPWGCDYHRMTERVNVKSLTQELPAAIDAVAHAVWAQPES